MKKPTIVHFKREYSPPRNGQLSFLIGNPELMFLKESTELTAKRLTLQDLK
jgi:hypothetical protein